jgi:hypothetical protein
MGREGHLAHMGNIGIVYKLLVVRSERKRQIGRYRRKWEDNVKENFREITSMGVVSI